MTSHIDDDWKGKNYVMQLYQYVLFRTEETGKEAYNSAEIATWQIVFFALNNSELWKNIENNLIPQPLEPSIREIALYQNVEGGADASFTRKLRGTDMAKYIENKIMT